MNKKPPAFIINGQPIPGSIWGRLLKLSETRYEAGLFIYRARNARSIVPYIMNGLKTKTLFNVRLEEEGSHASITKWIEEYILKYVPLKEVKKIVTVRDDNIHSRNEEDETAHLATRCGACGKELCEEERLNKNCWDCEHSW
jgi:hypothetical protein